MSTTTCGHHFRSVNYAGMQPGPRLMISGAVHGNETCGPDAIRRVLADLDAGKLLITSGSVTFVPVANPLAYARRERTGDRNLNRNLTPTDHPADFEDFVGNWYCKLLAQHDALLDLHSTRANNQAFAMLGPPDNKGPLQPFAHADQERALARHLGVKRFVDGWLDTYAIGVERRLRAAAMAGTPSKSLSTDPRYGIGSTEYMRSVGGYAITLECGQHDDPESPNVGYRAILNTLAFLGMIDAPKPDAVQDYEALHMYDVIDKMHAGDTFSREWVSFDPLRKGDLIGTRHDGSPVLAEKDGFILFPDAKAEPGNEWFYLTEVRKSI
jgi:predicted deacylase